MSQREIILKKIDHVVQNADKFEEEQFRMILEGLVKKGLRRLIKKEKVNALWIPNDIILCNVDLLKNSWVPMVSKYKVTVLVGVAALVNPKLNFGTFAVLPDNVALGAQTADLLFDIKEMQWEIRKNHVYHPVEVYQIVNFHP